MNSKKRINIARIVALLLVIAISVYVFSIRDQAQELADCINDMTASLRGKVIPIRTGLENILESAHEQNASNDLIEELEKLHQDILSNLKT